MPDTEWYQQSLVQADVVQVTTRVGLIPSVNHAQVLVECSDPQTGVLVAQWSVQHVPMSEYAVLMDRAHVKALQFADDATSPF